MSDIVTNFHLDKQHGSSRIITIKEINNCDSSFIVSCVLGHFIKHKNAVLIISTHNSFSHYQNIGLKMNYNLQKYLDCGLIEFYKLGEEHVNTLLSNQSTSLENVFNVLKAKIEFLREKHNVVNIIVDGISHLFDLQYKLRDVNNFCKQLIKSSRCGNNSFMMFHCNVASDDDDTNVLANLLCHQAYTVAEVENLSSGWSADVSGHITIKHPGLKFEDEHMHIMEYKPSKYLFKLFDRGVKLFAPGTV